MSLVVRRRPVRALGVTFLLFVFANCLAQVRSVANESIADIQDTSKVIIQWQHPPQVRSTEVTIDLTAPLQFEHSQNIAAVKGGIKRALTAEVGMIISKPIEVNIQSPAPFLAIGSVWEFTDQMDRAMNLSLRPSPDGKTWGSWIDVHVNDDVARQPGTNVGNLIFFPKDTKYLQYRIMLTNNGPTNGGVIRNLKLIFISPGETPRNILDSIKQRIKVDTSATNVRNGGFFGQPLRKTSEMATARQPFGISSVPQPPYASRVTWGCPDGESSPLWHPQYTTVTHIVIHHTATPNTSTDWPAVVRSIWQYHTYTKNWGDIGYNWLVDPNGVIYEGRAGGDNVIGAHFSCQNTYTMGVALIGDFSAVAPTSSALKSAEALLAWKCNESGINPPGSSYHPPTQLTLMNICGHRDANPSPTVCGTGTSCPGDVLYSELPDIRTAVYNMLSPPYLAAPVLSSPTNNATNQPIQPTFSWSPVNGAGSYRILVATNRASLPTDPTVGDFVGTGGVINATVVGTSYTPTVSLNPLTTYYWEVHARSTNYYGTWSSIYSFTTVGSQVSATVQTNPSGRSFIVDGNSYTSTHVFSWDPGSSHTIATTTPQDGGLGTRYVWSSWSDNQPMSHTVNPTSNTTYTANFEVQYYLTTQAGIGGTVNQSSGWHSSGQNVQIVAYPNTGYVFGGWTGAGLGSYSGMSNPATIIMNGPISETANFTKTILTYSITGRVIDNNNNGIQGVSMNLTGAINASTVSDASGNYSFSNLSGGGNYTVTPSKTGYSFSPPSITFNNLTQNSIANFTGTTVGNPVVFSMPSNVIGSAGSYVIVPLTIDPNGGSVRSFDVSINFNTNVLSFDSWSVKLPSD
ncbi:MAG: N-acetylmuramoyl-L-alanine amidase, partial [Candidatus Kryptoniota bacterium]